MKNLIPVILFISFTIQLNTSSPVTQKAWADAEGAPEFELGIKVQKIFVYNTFAGFSFRKNECKSYF
jgi:hypothetical protein